MSFFEDYVQDGLCCMSCGTLIDGDEPGYPRSCGCDGLADEEDEDESA